MRAPIWFGTIVAAAAMIGWFSSSGAASAPAAKGDAKAPLDERDEMANKLMEKTSIDEPIKDLPLREVLEMLSKKYDITLLADPRTFKEPNAAAAVNAKEEDALAKPISIPVMKKVRLATVLKTIGEQIDCVYLLYPDHIKFVGAGRAETLTNPNLKNYYPPDQGNGADPGDSPSESREAIVLSIPLLNVNFNDVPLQDALRQVEIRTNRSVVLAVQAGEKAKTSISTRFTNVPVDTAVAALAEAAGLKMARKGNVLLVTTAERAKEFDPPPPAPVVFNGLNGLNFNQPNVPQQATDAQIEELKKKVAELEKTIAELKKEKR